MLLGEKLKKLRKEKKLTQKALSDLVGLSRSYLADLEGNRSTPSLNVLVSISKALSVDINYFISDDEKKLETFHFKKDENDKIVLENILEKLSTCNATSLCFNGKNLDENDKAHLLASLNFALKSIECKRKRN